MSAKMQGLASLALLLGLLLLPGDVQSLSIASPFSGTWNSLLSCLGRTSDPSPLAEVKEQFKLDKERLMYISTTMLQEMQSGLNRNSNSCLLMLPSHLTAVPSGKEKGYFLALDLGGTNFRVLKVHLEGDGKFTIDSGKFRVSETLMVGPGKDLFAFIAQKVKQIVPEAAEATTPLPLGFTFSFPVEQTSLDVGKLVKWTKGFTCPGVEGNCVVSLLQKAFADEKLNIKVVALVNDTPGTMLAAAYSDPSVCAGLILGTGTNMCYLEKVKRAPKLQTPLPVHKMPSVVTWNQPPYVGPSVSHIINMEWGNFGSGAAHYMLPQTAYDEIVDRKSLNPGTHVYEKMISGMYLGEIARLVAVDMIARDCFLVGQAPSLFINSGAFTTETMAFIEAATSIAQIQEKLASLGVPAVSPADCRTLKSICVTVSTRAARLSAAGVASIALRLGKTDDCTIAVDGTVFQKYPGFRDRMTAALRDMLGRNMGVRFQEASDGSGVGAAIAAATAVASKSG